jgi:hypothetical protein
MTLSLYSTYKEWRRDAAAAAAAAQDGQDHHPIQSSVCHALVLLGMGIEGMSCGGDVTPSGKH